MQYLRYLCAVNELCAVLHGCVAVGKSKLYGVEIVHSRNIDRAEHVLGDARLKQVRFVAVDELCLKAGELEVLDKLCRGIPFDLVGYDLHVVAVVVKLKVRAELFLQMLEHILASHKQLHLRFAAGDPVYKSARCARRSERGITAFKNCDGSAGFAEKVCHGAADNAAAEHQKIRFVFHRFFSFFFFYASFAASLSRRDWRILSRVIGILWISAPVAA